jgi:replication-associated recombination protein RarA
VIVAQLDRIDGSVDPAALLPITGFIADTLLCVDSALRLSGGAASDAAASVLDAARAAQERLLAAAADDRRPATQSGRGSAGTRSAGTDSGQPPAAGPATPADPSPVGPRAPRPVGGPTAEHPQDPDRDTRAGSMLELVGQAELSAAAASAEAALLAGRPVRLLVSGPEGVGVRRVARHLAIAAGAPRLVEMRADLWDTREAASADLAALARAGGRAAVLIWGLDEATDSAPGQHAVQRLADVMDEVPLVMATTAASRLEATVVAAPNMLRRFSLVPTRDLSAAEIEQVFRQLARERHVQVAGEAEPVVRQMLGGVRPLGDLRNARIAEYVLEGLVATAALPDGDGIVRVSQQSARAAQAASLLAVVGGGRSEVAEVLAKVDRLQGQRVIKENMHRLAASAAFWAARAAAGGAVLEPSRHMLFTGPPGTGKTTVARLTAELYSALGALSSGHLVEATRSDLVGQYVGQTGPKTREVVGRALGGVLFIDEAYTLASGSGSDFGGEALAELLQMMEDHRHDLVVIAAGYTEPMLDLMRANPGLTSRFATQWEFTDFSDDELIGIWEAFVAAAGATVGEGTLQRVREAAATARGLPDFGNARTMRNLAEAAITNAIPRGEPLTVLPDDIAVPRR